MKPLYYRKCLQNIHHGGNWWLIQSKQTCRNRKGQAAYDADIDMPHMLHHADRTSFNKANKYDGAIASNRPVFVLHHNKKKSKNMLFNSLRQSEMVKCRIY